MLLSLHGQSADALSKLKTGGWEYDIAIPGYKCNMTDIMASIGLAQFERYEALLAKRKEIINEYQCALASYDVSILNHYGSGFSSSGHLFMVRLLGKKEQERNEVIMKMGELEIPTNVHYKPLPMHTAYKDLGFNIGDYPHAYQMYANEITLPLHTKLTEEEIGYIIENFRKSIL